MINIAGITPFMERLVTMYKNELSSVLSLCGSAFKELMKTLTASDYMFFGIVLFLIILLIVLLFIFKNSENNLRWQNEETATTKNSLESIAKEIEKNDESLAIDLTAYEKEEEEQAIISYEELVARTRGRQQRINVIEDNSTKDVSIKKVDVVSTTEPVVEDTYVSKVEFNYEKEEALLAALKQLKKNLS